MGIVDLNEIKVTSLKRIPVPGGDVLHALKQTEESFKDFGEAYFSMVEKDSIKAWKLHRQMTLNLIVPVGEVRFVFVSEDLSMRREEVTGEKNYVRLTVPPGIWFGFQGIGSSLNLILNIADILHDPDEVIRQNISDFKQVF